MSAVELADREHRHRPLPPDRYYDLACIYALAAASAEKDPSIDERLRRERSERCRSAAYDRLEHARAAGYFKSPDCRTHLPIDSHFQLLRNEPEFVSFVESLKEERS